MKVNVVCPEPLAAGVTVLVENCAVTPLGRPLTLNVVAEAKPFTLLTRIASGKLLSLWATTAVAGPCT